MAKRHLKASDVFDQTPSWLGHKVSFSEAFPNVELVTVKAEETDYGNLIKTHLRSSKSGLGEFINCTNPICFNGGIHIGDLIRHMVETGQTESKKDSWFCQGQEGTPKGKKIYGPCERMFSVQINIKYKTNKCSPTNLTK